MPHKLKIKLSKNMEYIGINNITNKFKGWFYSKEKGVVKNIKKIRNKEKTYIIELDQTSDAKNHR